MNIILVPVFKRSAQNPMNLIDLASAKIMAVQKIIDFLDSQSCDIVEIPSPPFADNHGPNHLFESTSPKWFQEEMRILIRF